eukprot:gene35550-58521_t
MSVNLQQLLSTVDYRSLDSRNKAIKLIIDHNISIRKAADACNISKSAVGRALEANKDNRKIGITGRPSLLNDNDLISFTTKFDKQLENNSKLTYNDIQHIAKDVFVNSENKNLATGIPKFHHKTIKNYIDDNGYKMATTRKVEK